MALKGKIYSLAKQYDDLNTNELFQSMIDESSTDDVVVMDGRNLAAGSIYSEQIHAGAITADKIRADAITADHMNVGSLSAISTNIGEITAGIIRSKDNGIHINLNTGIIDLSKPLTINSKPVATSEEVTQAVDDVDGRVDALSTRMSNAEVKIEPSAIVTTVTGHTTFKDVKEKAEAAKSTLDSKSSSWDAKATTGYVDGKASTAETNAKSHAEKISHVQPIDGTTKKFINLGGMDSRSASINGYLVIKTPITSPYMTRVKISGYNYLSNNTNLDLVVGFYAYSSSILQHSYLSSGDFAIDRVSLARDSNGRAVIIIGHSITNWKYPRISIDEATIGYQTPPDSYKDGWSAQITTDISAYDIKVSNVGGGDVNLKIDSAQETADTAKSTADTLKNTTVPQLTTRVNTAEQKITDKAIISTVTESSTYKNEMTGKVSVDEIISRINQTAEDITIEARRINLQGAVTFSSFGTDVTSKLDDIESDASTAKSTASSAQSTASAAKSTAAAASSTASTAKTTADTASSTASTAKATADTASSIASTARTTANTANTAAADAKSKTDKWSWGDTTEIDGGAIRTNTITANQIAAGSITADKIVMGTGSPSSGNLAAGHTFSGNYIGVTPGNGNNTIGSSYASFGSGGKNNNQAESDYIQVDLGSAQQIAESRIFFYAHDRRRYWYKIKYSTNGSTWFYAVGNSNNNGWTISRNPSSISLGSYEPTIDRFAVPITARYLRIYGNGNTVNTGNHIYEWELYSKVQTTISGSEIVTGTLSANQITTGVLEDLKKNTRFNLTNGTFNIGSKFIYDGSTLSIDADNINLSGKVTFSDFNSDLKSTIDSKVTQTDLDSSISNIEVGGRNLYLDSGREITSSEYTMATYNFAIKPIAGEKYTLSIKGEINPENHTGYYTNIYNGSEYPAMVIVGPGDLDSDGVYRKTFTMPHLEEYISTILYSYPIGKYVEASVEWIKLEKGTKSTDWTPAPEDVEASIGDVDNKASDAKNKTDSWTYSGETTIDGGAIQADTITAAQIVANSITSDLIEVDEISALTSKLGDVTAGTITSENGNIHIDLNEGFMDVADGMFKIQGKDVADTESLGQLEGKINKEVEHREGFISFEGGIVTIGQKDSPTNIQIKNDRISFMQNGTEVAYITEQTMEITHGIFVETAKIGEHKQQTLSGGHTVFTWEG